MIAFDFSDSEIMRATEILLSLLWIICDTCWRVVITTKARPTVLVFIAVVHYPYCLVETEYPISFEVNLLILMRINWQVLCPVGKRKHKWKGVFAGFKLVAVKLLWVISSEFLSMVAFSYKEETILEIAFVLKSFIVESINWSLE